MAHGRTRSFFGGAFVGAVAVVLLAVATIYGLGLTFGPPGYPYFNEPSARAATLEWARLSPFPAGMKSFTIVTAGSMFTRQFQVAFFGEPAEIEAWVRSCPGVMDEKTQKETAADGTVIYTLAVEGSGFAELKHHPLRGTIEITTSWS